MTDGFKPGKSAKSANLKISEERLSEIIAISVVGLVFAHADTSKNEVMDFADCLNRAEGYIAAVKTKFGVDLIAEIRKS